MTQSAHRAVPVVLAPTEAAPTGQGPTAPPPAEPARPLASPDRTLHMIGNSHIDPVWLWPWQEGYQEARATFRSAIDRMNEYDDFVFTCDQMQLLAWVEEADPDLFAAITARVREGRWVNVGGWWVEPDCNIPTGEAFARQGLLGQRYLMSRFGRPATVGMNADPFGHNAMLPQILDLQGMTSYCFLRPAAHECAMPYTVFWWESPDGSRVLGYRIPHEYCSPPGSIVGQTEKALGQLDRTLDPLMVFYGVGNHGGGPTKANIDSIHRFDAIGAFGRLTLSDPERYVAKFAAAQGEAGMAALPVWAYDLQFHAVGCYSAHSGIKLWQREAQHAVLTAEKWAAVAAHVSGRPYPQADLTRAWQQIAFNQFHDILPGSAIEPAYADARDQLGEAVAIAKRALTWAHNQIARRVAIPYAEGTQPVVVFNPHPWTVTSDIEMRFGPKPAGAHLVDEAGRRVATQHVQSPATVDQDGRDAVVFRATVPPLGYRLYRALPLVQPVPTQWSDDAPLDDVVATPTVLENEFLRAEFDPATGWLVSLLDKATGTDPLAGAVGDHTVVTADSSDTWGHRIISYAGAGTPMHLRRMVVRETGAVRGRLRVERTWGRSTMAEEFLLSAGARHLDVRVTIDWHETAHLLKLRFPVGVSEPVATQEIPYGFVSRDVNAAEVPGQSWVDLTGVDGSGRTAGLVVVNNAKHGYDFSPAGEPVAGWTPSVGITALRSCVYACHDPRTLNPDDIYAYQDQGVQHFAYRLVPHAGDWRGTAPARHAAELAARPRAQLESFHDGTLPAVGSYVQMGTVAGDGQVVVTALKGAEDDPAATVVRAVETLGRGCTARLTVLGRTIEAEFGPNQIRTFLVPPDPTPLTEVDLVEWPIADRARGAWREV